jgi:hypothetical protein
MWVKWWKHFNCSSEINVKVMASVRTSCHPGEGDTLSPPLGLKSARRQNQEQEHCKTKSCVFLQVLLRRATDSYGLQWYVCSWLKVLPIKQQVYRLAVVKVPVFSHFKLSLLICTSRPVPMSLYQSFLWCVLLYRLVTRKANSCGWIEIGVKAQECGGKDN